MTPGADALFDLGHQTLRTLGEELALHQVYIDPNLELRRGAGLLCYYHLQDGHIYLSVPDGGEPRGKFELFFLRSVIDLESSSAVMRFLELLIPWLIAHEVGHHLLHKYGTQGLSIREEERIASQFGVVFVQRLLSVEQVEELLNLLENSIVKLDKGLRAYACRYANGEKDPAGQDADPAGLDRDPAGDPVRYVQAHMRWLYQALVEPGGQTMAEFVIANFKQSG